jgi:hypothetical protein
MLALQRSAMACGAFMIITELDISQRLLLHRAVPFFFAMFCWLLFLTIQRLQEPIGCALFERCVDPRRHNTTLRRLDLKGNPISASVLTSVELELVLCQMRNAAVTNIDASRKGFDDADALRISDALRCAYGFAAALGLCVFCVLWFFLGA